VLGIEGVEGGVVESREMRLGCEMCVGERDECAGGRGSGRESGCE
jgi:hypothetical protein